MPLSLMGIEEIRKAAREKSVDLTILLDQRANIENAKKLVQKFNLSPADLRKFESSEMIARGVGLHFPVAMFYKGGILSSRVYFGHKSAKIYSEWIDFERELFEKNQY